MKMNDDKIMSEIDKFIDDILYNRYFKNNNFKNKLQDFIYYEERIVLEVNMNIGYMVMMKM